MTRGMEIHGEISSADLTTAAAFTVYDAGGNAVTVASTDRLVFTDLIVSSAIAMNVDVYGGSGASAGAGELIANITLSTTSGAIVAQFSTPFYVKKGITPKLKASAAGAIKATFTGFLLRA